MTRSCGVCSASYEAARSDSKFCGERCRKRAQRGHVVSLSPDVARPESGTGGTVAAVRAELETAGRSGTHLGAAALALAERIDGSTAVMGFAALVKELRLTMEAAVAGVKVAADPVDELRSRRDAKYAG